MRSAASLASVLAGTAAVVSSQDHHVGLPFYVGLAVMGLVNAWAVNALHEDRRRWVAIGSALVWAHAAGWVAVLLVFPFQASSPPPVPDQTFVGIPVTAYRVVGLFGGAALVLGATFAPERWVRHKSQPSPS